MVYYGFERPEVISKPMNHLINRNLRQLCWEANALGADLLDLDGELKDEVAIRIATNKPLAELRSDLQNSIEQDVGHSLGDPNSRVSLIAQDPFYLVSPFSINLHGIYNRLVAFDGKIARVEGAPLAVKMAYHKEDVHVPRQGIQRVPTVNMCLAIGDAFIRSTYGGDEAFDEVLFPFSELNTILPSMPPRSSGSDPG
jgi:hypothetical protein